LSFPIFVIGNPSGVIPRDPSLLLAGMTNEERWIPLQSWRITKEEGEVPLQIWRMTNKAGEQENLGSFRIYDSGFTA
jgi:hypothetical protein